MEKESQTVLAKVKELSKLNPIYSSFAIFLEYLIICLTIYAVEYNFNLLSYVAAVLIIGSRFQGLGILLHEGTHYRLANSKKINDLIGELFLALPLIFITLFGYKKMHIKHHKYLTTENDPDWVQDRARKEFYYPKSKKEFFKIVFKYLIGFYAITESGNLEEYTKSTKSLKIVRNILFFSIILLSILFSFWKLILLYWIVPLSTSFLFFMYIRALSDHHLNLERSHDYSKSRTVLLNPLAAFIFFPWNINYHIEHHIYPQIPFYNLKKLHEFLNENSEEFRTKSHITNGMSGLLIEAGLVKK